MSLREMVLKDLLCIGQIILEFHEFIFSVGLNSLMNWKQIPQVSAPVT